MAIQNKPRIIALEEHYWDQEVAATIGAADAARRSSGIVERLYDYSELRIKEMDEAGIDVQVLSHAPPATQQLDPETSTKLASGPMTGSMRLSFPGPTGSRHLPLYQRQTLPALPMNWSVAL